MSVFYTAIPMAALALIGLRGGEYDYRTVLAIIAITWINDIFAYIVGITMGRHRLFERISPKKSWEGFFGGLLFATAAAVAVGAMLGESLLLWGGVGVVVVVAAVLGDLVESMFKRSVGVKDSGALIPGHGGMLDRFDALLFAAPFVLFYLTIVTL
jgi:phosphatidate cytidylyltransferase